MQFKNGMVVDPTGYIGTKYASPMAFVVDTIVNEGGADELVSNPEWGESLARVGRRILQEFSDGWVESYRCKSEQEAHMIMESFRKENEAWI